MMQIRKSLCYHRYLFMQIIFVRESELLIGDYENRLLKGDMERAFEVMENLLENAFKYGDGRTIAIDFYEEDYCQVIRVFNTGEVRRL